MNFQAMTSSSHSLRSLMLTCVASVLPLGIASAAEPLRIVLQNGRSVPVSAVVAQGTGYSVTAAVDGFMIGQALPAESVDHVYGDKPPELNPAIALLLMDRPADALKLLEPIVAAQRITAKIPGNFWLDAARAALVAYAVTGNSSKCTELGKEISDATPSSGSDPFVLLGKALLLPPSTKDEERAIFLRDLTADGMPSDVSAYASIYLGNLLKAAKRNPDAALAANQDKDTLEAYLSVPCLFSSGGLVLNGVAEFKASELLIAMGRRDEALALLKSSARHSIGTLVAVEGNKRLESIK